MDTNLDVAAGPAATECPILLQSDQDAGLVKKQREELALRAPILLDYTLDAMKSRFGLAPLVFALSLAAPSVTLAELITYDLQVLIEDVFQTGDVSGLPNIAAGITAGATVIQGSLSYETSQAGVTAPLAGGLETVYSLSGATFAFPAQRFNFDDTGPTFPGGIAPSVRIRDDVDFGFGVNDQLVVFGTAFDGVYEVSTIFGLCCNYTDSSVFRNTELPLQLNLSDFPAGFPGRVFTFNYIDPDFDSSFAGSWNFRGSIISVERVPEPATIFLVAIALAVICRFGRGKLMPR